ncbi:Bifunctional epoxide hydrolase 2 [Aphelenchoides fujianensis]|nr:Bifunctional epoxide hydrolase 2 [Aphelenchoides fujianensis]
MGGVLFRFKNAENVHRLIAQFRQNPEQMATYVALERGEITIEDIGDLLDLAFPGLSEIKDFDKANPTDYLGPINEDMIQAAKKIQAHGFKVGVITNNYFWQRNSDRTTSIPQIYEFDAVLESCKLGVRKPERRIFEIMLEELGVDAHECVFVDDFPSNVDAAVQLGMSGIELENEDTRATIRKLEELLHVSLF